MKTGIAPTSLLLAGAALGLALAGCSPHQQFNATLPTPNAGSCRFPLPDKVYTIVYHNEGGDDNSTYLFLDHPHRFLSLREIKVPKRDRPQFLVLTRHGSVEWRLQVDPEAKIAAILAVGDEPQVVSHVPPNTRVAFDPDEGAKGYDCPKGLFSQSQPLAPLLPGLRNEYGVHVTEFNSANILSFPPSDADCKLIACTNNGMFGDKPSPSLWQTLFGQQEPPPPEGEVRTSEALQFR